MKKAKGFLALVLAVLMIGCSAMVGFAANDLEIEPNDTIETATLFSVGKTIEGSLNTADDVDYFKFVTDKDGLVTVTFEHETADSASPYFEVAVLGEDGTVFSNATSAGSSKTETLAFGAKAGTFFVEVKASNVHSGKNYSVSAALDTNVLTENEPNDESTAANALKLSSGSEMNLYQGSITTADADYYRFTAPKDGYINLYLDAYGIQKGALTVTLIAFYGDGANREKAVASKTVKVGEAGAYSDQISIAAKEYYLKVTADQGTTVGGYSTLVYFTADGASEHEYNNETNVADIVTVTNPTYGSTFDANDVDYFKVTTSAAKDMTLTIKATSFVQGDASWNVVISSAKAPGTPIAGGTRSFSKSSELTFDFPSKTADTYYIRITAGSVVNSGRYQISVAEKPAPEKKLSLWERIKALDWSLWADAFSFLKEIDVWSVTVSIFRSFFGRGQA